MQNEFESTWTFKRRVARELDFYRTRANISYEELARQIMREMPLEPYKRGDYKPLSARSLKELVRGTRSSQRRVVRAASDFLTKVNGFPTKFGRSLVFDLDPDVLELAIRQARFFGVHSLSKEFVSSFEGRYSIVRPQSMMSYDLIIDYYEELGILLARGNIRFKDDPEEAGVKSLFLSGYAIASKESLSIFLTDHHQPNAYIVQLPLSGEFDISRDNFFFKSDVRFLSGRGRGEEATPFHEAILWPRAYLENKCYLTFFPFYPKPNDREHFAGQHEIMECFRDIFFDNEFLATEQLRLVIGARSYPGRFDMLPVIAKSTKYLEFRNYATFAETVIRLFSYSGATPNPQPLM